MSKTSSAREKGVTDLEATGTLSECPCPSSFKEQLFQQTSQAHKQTFDSRYT